MWIWIFVYTWWCGRKRFLAETFENLQHGIRAVFEVVAERSKVVLIAVAVGRLKSCCIAR
jgi:hypothetical protein